MHQRSKTMSQSLVVSLVIHGVLLAGLGVLLIAQTQLFQDLIATSLTKTSTPPKPRVRKPNVKPVIKPVAAAESAVYVKPVASVPRATTMENLKSAEVSTEDEIVLANRQIKSDTPPKLHQPTVTNNTSLSTPASNENLPASDSPGSLTVLTPVPGAAEKAKFAVQSRRRGAIVNSIGKHVDVSSTPGLGQTHVVGDALASVDDALTDVNQNVLLGNDVPPLEAGTPGAIILGRGRELSGRLHLSRFTSPTLHTLV